MDHFDNDERISAYLDGELSADEQAQFEERLAESAELRTLVEELRALRGSLDLLPRHKLEADFAERILRRAEKEMLIGGGGSNAGGGDAATARPAPLVRSVADDDQAAGRLARMQRRAIRPLVYVAAAIAAAVMIVVFTPPKPKDVVDVVGPPKQESGDQAGARSEGKQGHDRASKEALVKSMDGSGQGGRESPGKDAEAENKLATFKKAGEKGLDGDKSQNGQHPTAMQRTITRTEEPQNLVKAQSRSRQVDSVKSSDLRNGQIAAGGSAAGSSASATARGGVDPSATTPLGGESANEGGYGADASGRRKAQVMSKGAGAVSGEPSLADLKAGAAPGKGHGLANGTRNLKAGAGFEADTGAVTKNEALRANLPALNQLVFVQTVSSGSRESTERSFVSLLKQNGIAWSDSPDARTVKTYNDSAQRALRDSDSFAAPALTAKSKAAKSEVGSEATDAPAPAGPGAAPATTPNTAPATGASQRPKEASERRHEIAQHDPKDAERLATLGLAVPSDGDFEMVYVEGSVRQIESLLKDVNNSPNFHLVKMASAGQPPTFEYRTPSLYDQSQGDQQFGALQSGSGQGKPAAPKADAGIDDKLAKDEVRTGDPAGVKIPAGKFADQAVGDSANLPADAAAPPGDFREKSDTAKSTEFKSNAASDKVVGGREQSGGTKPSVGQTRGDAKPNLIAADQTLPDDGKIESRKPDAGKPHAEPRAGAASGNLNAVQRPAAPTADRPESPVAKSPEGEKQIRDLEESNKKAVGQSAPVASPTPPKIAPAEPSKPAAGERDAVPPAATATVKADTKDLSDINKRHDDEGILKERSAHFGGPANTKRPAADQLPPPPAPAAITNGVPMQPAGSSAGTPAESKEKGQTGAPGGAESKGESGLMRGYAMPLRSFSVDRFSLHRLEQKQSEAPAELAKSAPAGAQRPSNGEAIEPGASPARSDDAPEERPAADKLQPAPGGDGAETRPESIPLTTTQAVKPSDRVQAIFFFRIVPGEAAAQSAAKNSAAQDADSRPAAAATPPAVQPALPASPVPAVEKK